jgi:hypothetical protein
MMLDTAATFDGLVPRHADSDEQIERILTNPLYRNIAGALSGTQEYMAAETLHDLHGDERFDLVVVDTPPSRNALDFLEAPGVLARFLDHRAFRLLMLPTRGGLKVIGTATQPILKAIGKVVGSDVLSDSVAFFQAFAGMETGFRERATDVHGADPRARDVVRGGCVAAARHHRRGGVVRKPARRPGCGRGRGDRQPDPSRFGHGDAADAARQADAARRDGAGVLAACGTTWRSCARLANSSST